MFRLVLILTLLFFTDAGFAKAKTKPKSAKVKAKAVATKSGAAKSGAAKKVANRGPASVPQKAPARAPASEPKKKIVVIKMSPESRKKKSKFERAMSPAKKLDQTVGVHFGSGHVKESDVEPLPQHLLAKVPVLPDVPRPPKVAPKKQKREVAGTKAKAVKAEPLVSPEESMRDFRKAVDAELSEYEDGP